MNSCGKPLPESLGESFSHPSQTSQIIWSSHVQPPTLRFSIEKVALQELQIIQRPQEPPPRWLGWLRGPKGIPKNTTKNPPCYVWHFHHVAEFFMRGSHLSLANALLPLLLVLVIDPLPQVNRKRNMVSKEGMKKKYPSSDFPFHKFAWPFWSTKKFKTTWLKRITFCASQGPFHPKSWPFSTSSCRGSQFCGYPFFSLRSGKKHPSLPTPQRLAF